jgi:hypothetical protein
MIAMAWSERFLGYSDQGGSEKNGSEGTKKTGGVLPQIQPKCGSLEGVSSSQNCCVRTISTLELKSLKYCNIHPGKQARERAERKCHPALQIIFHFASFHTTARDRTSNMTLGGLKILSTAFVAPSVLGNINHPVTTHFGSHKEVY